MSAAVVDTNVLVYAFDPRDPWKQRQATELLSRALDSRDHYLPHQTIVEFVAATSRARPAQPALLSASDACREAELLLSLYPVLYPDEAVLRTALRGAVAYQMSWFDAHLWAYAESNGIPRLLSEDLQHGRLYGSVRVENPFLDPGEEGSRGRRTGKPR